MFFWMSRKMKKEVIHHLVTIGIADSLGGRSSHTVLKFTVAKENQEENCDVITEKTENKVIEVKTEQPDDLLQDEVFSKFSDSGDDNNLNSLKYVVISRKKESQFQELQQIKSGLESTSGKYKKVSLQNSKFIVL
ncbi:uncharacterized protein LOC111089831 isoform X2 [Limulus polyphemus]|uniref:Uncharacterized protein LOC111089831 isoform X2 n=1 Tax=Limulus polyphemus TaxID=6850 RepID=A0ABM1TS38_LIMPO|nr:uncharacterized protein LOC111089831 isoform X2 [Limulus polyphemus]XP_022258695.1 uncharacterized protein LOC111089831 isoform X2 [Limulus polyphemus]